MQAGQELSPRQALLIPRQIVLVPRQAGSLSQERIQAVQPLSPRLTESVPPRKEGRQHKHSFPGRQPTAQEYADNVGTHSQAGIPNLLPFLLRRSAGSADTLPQADQSLSPRQGVSGTTVQDTTSSPDNTSITGEKGQRCRGQAPQPPQLG